MKRIIVLLVMISLVLLISCTKKVETCTITEKDGVKIYKNTNTPTVEKLDFNPVKKFTINNDPEDEHYLTYFDLDGLGTDSEKNIYIANIGRDPRVNKYDKDGKFVKTFLTMGTGPGEMQEIGFLCAKNDTVYVGERFTTRVSLFDTDGKFLSYQQSEGHIFGVNPVGKNKFLCLMFVGFIENGQQMFRTKWVLLNNSFKSIKVLHEIKVDPQKASIPDQWSYITSSKDKIYLGVNDKNVYTVNIYDYNGELVEVIQKDYIAVKYTQEEIDKIASYLTATNQMPLDKTLLNKKRAVLGVYVDKNENLIIHPAEDITKTKPDGIKLDFFNKDNAYLNSTLFKTESPYYQCEYMIFPKFFDDRMLISDGVRNVLDVYEY
ncbi:MAG: hypothetical protein PF638_06575 [Candidatus Delongbacteria bacterium]|jgi:hypothetical protein|nr:hypothetical protein [Candidatus Delongbacteria bacterium]